MSFMLRQGSGPVKQSSPGTTPTLPSNNPFRNRNASPANGLPSPVNAGFSLQPTTAPERPTSRNPFLDNSEKTDATTVRLRGTSPPQSPAVMDRSSKPTFSSNAEALFDNLKISGEPKSTGTRQAMPPPYAARSQRGENVAPKPTSGLPGHSLTKSQEGGQRRLPNGLGVVPRQKLDIFADPPDATKQRHRMRRNSDSSIASRLLSPEEEQQRRERHRKEREARHRERRDRPPGTTKGKKPVKRLDVIDSLDVTSIYGTGLFHHDGPFDACNPDRNRRGSRRAPMQAFAKDSANNTIGGSGPVNKDINFNQFHGRGDEGFTDYATSGAKNPAVEVDSFEPYAGSSAPSMGPSVRPGVDRSLSFNPIARGDPLHGEESMGLGTSTFLDGAPAARAVIERRNSETEMPQADVGLGRKRSIAQRIRGLGSTRGDRGFRPSGRITSPDGVLRPMTSPGSPQERTMSAGGLDKIKESENPFFNDYDDAYEKKGTKIQIAEERNRMGSIDGGDEAFTATSRSRTVSSPKKPATSGLLERRVTNDAAGLNGGESSGGVGGGASSGGGGAGGFLSRVKSLKGGKRSRP